jgi:hypothetical protein
VRGGYSRYFSLIAMRRTSKLILVMLLALSATGCHFARSGSQPIDFDPFANPALKAADDAE